MNVLLLSIFLVLLHNLSFLVKIVPPFCASLALSKRAFPDFYLSVFGSTSIDHYPFPYHHNAKNGRLTRCIFSDSFSVYPPSNFLTAILPLVLPSLFLLQYQEEWRVLRRTILKINLMWYASLSFAPDLQEFRVCMEKIPSSTASSSVNAPSSRSVPIFSFNCAASRFHSLLSTWQPAGSPFCRSDEPVDSTAAVYGTRSGTFPATSAGQGVDDNNPIFFSGPQFIGQSNNRLRKGSLFFLPLQQQSIVEEVVVFPS